MEETGFRGTINKLDCAVKREKRSRDKYSSSDDDQEDSKHGIFSLKDNKLELAKAEMGEVKEENQRLKKHLSQIIEEYKNLHKKFRDAADHNQQEIELQGNESATTHHQEHDHLVSLRLGRNAPASTSYQKNKNENLRRNKSNPNYEDEDDKEGLALGLDCKFESPTIVSSADNSVEEVMNREETLWPPGKVLKKDKSSNGDDHEAPQQNPAAKKTRVSVRARCDTPTMNDGCQWRKYGQKISKGNPCPRAYYRCTVSTTCPVRKQVQRCAQDMSILITTYEGTHNHPLSMPATAMASTTSAAASMLISGSSTSGSSNPNNRSSSTTTPAELHGLNFYLSDGSKPNPFYPQNPNSPSCPTITLDLTSNTISSSPLINRSTSSNSILPRYSTTNLNFGSWNNMNGALTYAPNSQSYINNYQSLNFGRHYPSHQENIYQPYMQNNNMQQSFHANSIEAATNAITSDPNFQSALQAVLSSIINSSTTTGPSGSGSGGGGSGSGQNSKLTEALFPVLSSFVPSTSNANNLLKKSSSPTENLTFPPPPNSSSSFSASKSKSTSSDDSRDHVI